MRFYLTGEGPSDLCEKSTGRIGLLKDALVEISTLDAPPEAVDYVGVAHAQLIAFSGRTRRQPREMLMRGNKRMMEKLADIARTAEALGFFVRAQNDGECGAVMFTDCDFTNSEVNNPDRYHLQMIAAIETGFNAADDFRNGVAMVPKMRSESWLLCKYQRVPYAPSGEKFEKLPANDESENCAKKVLARFLGLRVNEMYERKIYSDSIDWLKIDCPSYKFFARRFRYVLCRMAHMSPPCIEPETLVTQGARL